MEAINASCNLYDGVSGYRIADLLTSRFFRHTAGGVNYHQNNYPQSLAVRFQKYYYRGTLLWREHYANTTCAAAVGVRAPGFCQCYVPPVLAVLDMIRRDEARAKASGTFDHGESAQLAHGGSAPARRRRT